jgi:RNA polymerase sigma-70 factor (ECF subfamily)
MNIESELDDRIERELVAGAGAGDRTALKAIYDRYRSRVHNLVYYTLDQPLLTDDVVQTVFLKLFRGLPGFRFEAALSTWIYRIALNECLNQNRTRNRYVPLEEILGSRTEIDPGPGPDERNERSEAERIIHQAVMNLSSKLRTVVVLKYLEGLSYDEIAAVLDCAPGTVASRLNRALAELESKLRPLKHFI